MINPIDFQIQEIDDDRALALLLQEDFNRQHDEEMKEVEIPDNLEETIKLVSQL